MRMTIWRGTGLALCMILAAPAFYPISPAGVGARAADEDTDAATGTLVEKQIELSRLQRKLRELRTGAMQARKTQVERVKELASEKRVLERGLDGLKELVKKREAEVGKRKTDTEEKKKKIAELTKRAESIHELYEEFLDRVKEHIDSSIKWKESLRKTSLEKVKSVVAIDKTALGEGLGAISRIQREEESLARLVETGVLQINLAEETRAVQAFHLGLLAIVFASEDGRLVGYAQRGEDPADSLDAAKEANAVEGYLTAWTFCAAGARPPSSTFICRPFRRAKGRSDR